MVLRRCQRTPSAQGRHGIVFQSVLGRQGCCIAAYYRRLQRRLRTLQRTLQRLQRRLHTLQHTLQRLPRRMRRRLRTLKAVKG